MGELDLPLTKARTAIEVTALFVEEGTVAALLTVVIIVVAIGRSSSWVDNSLIARFASEKSHLEN